MSSDHSPRPFISLWSPRSHAREEEDQTQWVDYDEIEVITFNSISSIQQPASNQKEEDSDREVEP